MWVGHWDLGMQDITAFRRYGTRHASGPHSRIRGTREWERRALRTLRRALCQAWSRREDPSCW